MNFFKKYWYLLIVTIITVGIGAVAYLTSTKLENQQPVAPNVPQVTPHAAATACRLSFALTVNTPTPTNTGSPTETPTNTPTGNPTATPSNTPTATPTDQPGNTKPECTGLTITPNTGIPPYTATLTCSGKDVDGDITAVEFTLPDGTKKLVEQNVGSPGSLTTTYTVTTGGAYSFSCQVRDNNNAWVSSDACRISVGPTPTSGPTPTPTPIPTPKIPVAGVPSVLGASVVAGGVFLLLLGLVF